MSPCYRDPHLRDDPDMNSASNQNSPLSHSAQASPNLPSQSRPTVTHAARERRQLQNRNAQRNHRLRRAAQKALHSQGQGSQQESTLIAPGEPKSIWSSRLTPVDVLPTPPFSRDQGFTIHSADVGLDDCINVDSRPPDDVLFGYDSSDQADANFPNMHASHLSTDSTPALTVRSSDVCRTSPPLFLELAGSRPQHSDPPRQNQTTSGQLAIHIASKRGFASIIHVLLTHGADLNLIDSRGRTALHYAVEGSHVESSKVLLHWGADPLATDSSGLSSLHIAVSKGDYNVVCLLMDHGVDPNLGALANDAKVKLRLSSEPCKAFLGL